MKRVVLALFLAACGLNPQPFPPDNPDGAVTGAPDASKGNGDAAFGNEAGSAEDASADSEPVPQSDGGSADADASDALVDAPEDAPVDAIEDVATD